MPDNKSTKGAARNREAGEDKYDAASFAKKHGIPTEDAKRIVNQHGSDRDSADRAANRLKG